MLRKHMFALNSTLATALFCFTAAPAAAQGLVTVGAGSYISPSNPSQTSYFTHLIRDAGGGAAHGVAIFFFPTATIVIDVTSYGFFELTPGTTSLAYAGTISAIFGTPMGPLATIGRPAYVAVNDNGWGTPDETTGLSLLPPFVPLGPMPSIQQIFAFFQSLPNPPAPVWAPLVSGNILVRY